MVSLNVLGFFVFGSPPAGLFLDLEPRVDIVLEETLLRMGEMPQFIDVHDLVALLDGLLELRGAPRTVQSSLVVPVMTRIRFAHQGLGQLLLHTGGAQRKSQFAPLSVRQYGMVQISWWKDLALGHAKVLFEVSGVHVVVKLGMSHGVTPSFVHPWVQGGEVIILDLLFTLCLVVEFDGIGPSPVKCVARFQRWG